MKAELAARVYSKMSKLEDDTLRALRKEVRLAEEARDRARKLQHQYGKHEDLKDFEAKAEQLIAENEKQLGNYIATLNSRHGDP